MYTNKKHEAVLKKIEEETAKVIKNNSENFNEIIKDSENNINDKLIKLENKIDFLENRIIELQNQNYRLETELLKINKFNYINPEYLFLNNDLTTKKKVLLIGFYGAPNLGDELMMHTLINNFSKYENIDLTVMLANNPNYNIFNYKKIKFIHYPQTMFDFEILAEKYDAFVYGGGALLDDTQYNIQYTNEVSLSTVVIELSIKAKEKNKETYFIGLSSNDKFTNEVYIERLKEVVKDSNYFSLRDKNSLKTFEKYNINISKIEIIDDIVLSNDIQRSENKETKSYINIGVILIGSDNRLDKFNLVLLNQLIKVLNVKKIEYKINFIPFYDYCNYDTNYYKQLKEKIKSDNIYIKDYVNTLSEIKKVILEQDYIISARYHGSLLSLFMNKNTLTIINSFNPHYNNKMNYIFEEYNFDKKIISAKEKNPRNINNIINNFLNSDFKNINTQKIINRNIENIERIIKNICEL